MLRSLRKDGVFDKCPDCKAVGVLRRSRSRNFWEKILKNLRIANLYRCRECGWRGIKSNFSIKKISLKVLFYYLLFILFVAIVVRFIILKFVMK